MFDTHTMRSPGVAQPIDQRRGDERALPRILVRPVDHGRPSASPIARADGAGARRRPDRRSRRPRSASVSATPARAGRRLGGIARPARRGRATSAPVPPAAPRRARRAPPRRRARRTAPTPPNAHPITTSTPARAAAQSSGTVATVRPARASRIASSATWLCDGRDHEHRPDVRAANATADSTAGITSARGGSRSTPPPRRRASVESSPATSGHGPAGRERDAGREPTTARSGDAVTRNGRIRPAAQRTDAHSASSMISALGPGAGDLRRSASARSSIDGVGVVDRAASDPAADPAAVEVDTHTRADLHRRFEMFGNEVVERLVETRDVGQDSSDQRT